MSDITVEAVVSLKLKLPPESAAIIGEIIIGDRVFTPNGEHQIEIPTQEFAEAVEQLETKKAAAKKKPVEEAKTSGKLSKRICENKRCQKSFVPKNKRSRFCSPKCGQEVYQANYTAKQKSGAKPTNTTPKKKPSFGAAGATPDIPVGRKPLDLGDPQAPRSYARQGD